MKLTQQYLKSILHYNPENGFFIWKKSTRKIKVGDVAGCLNIQGYIQIKIDGKLFQAHRLAFLYVTGEFPVNDVDHINGNKSDNRFSNLRKATRQENARNRGVNSNNKLRIKGVYENKSGSYVAQILLNKKSIISVLTLLMKKLIWFTIYLRENFIE